MKAGELIIISGTTNLPPGHYITIEIIPVITRIIIDPDYKTITSSSPGETGSALIISGSSQVHQWSWIINSSDLPPARYEVTASSPRNQAEKDTYMKNDFLVGCRFNLTG